MAPESLSPLPVLVCGTTMTPRGGRLPLPFFVLCLSVDLGPVRNNLCMYLFMCIWVSICVFALCQWIFTLILTLRLFQIWPVVSVQADFRVLLVLSSFWGKDLYNITLHRPFVGGGFGGEYS